MEKPRDKGATKLSRARQSRKKRRTGVSGSGGAKIRVAWAAPPEEGGHWAPTHGPGGGDAALEPGRWTTAVTPGTLCKHSQERRVRGRSTRRASPARGLHVRKKRLARGSGRESSALSVPDTSLRPVTALGRSCNGSSRGWSHNSAAKCPSCPVIFPRAPVWPREH